MINPHSDPSIAAVHFSDIFAKDGSYKGFPVPKAYWQQLCCCAESHSSDFTFKDGESALWNLHAELRYAKGDSHQKLMMAFAFIASCEFEHSTAGFEPFKMLRRVPVYCKVLLYGPDHTKMLPYVPDYHKVMDKYVELLQHGAPRDLEITSTLKLVQESTMFERVPFEVIQHAVLNTTTFEFTHTYAEVIWDDGAAPEICPGTFVPSKQCKWHFPDHP